MKHWLAGLKQVFFRLFQHKESALVVGILTLGIFIRLIWVAYSQSTAEDAYITFQFARRLAEGHGFVYNLGEPVYGTSTPLFTLLMAGWLFLTQAADVALGAHLADIFASMGSLVILALILQKLNVSFPARFFALTVLAFSPKIYLIELQGMEMPVLTLLMMASWYALICNHPNWAGFFAGCLLWTRIDLGLWPVTLILIAATLNFKNALRVGWMAALTYLPWLIFATLYFGSPIPYTITAKWVMYAMAGPPPEVHLATVIKALSPFAFTDAQFSDDALLIMGSLVLAVALWQTVCLYKQKQNRLLFVLPAFALFETIKLVLTGSTFFSRYFHALLWVVLILFALGLVSFWQSLTRRWALSIWIPRVVLAAGLMLLVSQGVYRFDLARFEQTYQHDGSLRKIGNWLNTHTAPDAVVYLEPLGYVGYYANRKMIDTIGLVTPSMVDLRLKGIDPQQYVYIFLPDYFIEHCDDGLNRINQTADDGKRFVEYYQIAAEFNPLHFNPKAATTMFSDPVRAGIARNACYDIWQRIK